MSTINVDVSSDKSPILEVGYQGENGVTVVNFDVSSWQELFGSGDVTLYIKRKGDVEPYFVELEVAENIATWIVSNVDTANKGKGTVQLNYIVDSVLKRTQIYNMKVNKSLVDSDEVPDPYDDWLEEIRQGVHIVQEFGESLQENVDNWLDQHPEATTTVQDGSITLTKLYPALAYKVDNPAVLNVASMVGGDLTSANIASAITSALEYSRYLFIPAGEYTFNITIMDDCVIIMDKECYIFTDSTLPCIYALGCSISIYGGNVCAGQDDASRVPVFGTYSSTPKGIIVLEECHECVISNVNTPYSKYSGVYYIKDCVNVTFENLKFENILFAGIRVLNYNENIVVRNCSFENIDMMMDGDNTAILDYCYAICTGATTLSANFTPPDNLLFENNYIYDSEDCAIDTHGATNVIIRNNTVLESVCSITAYNDNKRVKRPNGWKMRNILIENNYCASSKDNAPGRDYPHPFIFLGASNGMRVTDTGYADNPGDYYSYINLVVRNNYFDSPNSCENKGIIYLNNVTRDVVIENNFINCHEANRPTYFCRSINFSFKNNSVMNANTKRVLFEKSCGIVDMNIGARYDFANSTDLSYIKNGNGTVNMVRSPLIDFGDFTTISGAKVCTSTGRRVRSDYSTTSFSITVEDGITTVPNTLYVPFTALILNGTTSGGTVVTDKAAYISDVIDMSSFKLVDASWNAIADGTYTATIRQATVHSLA